MTPPLARALVAKAIGTFALVFAGAGAIMPDEKTDTLFGGAITGASMNPARSLGPAFAAAELDSIWIYILAPLLGAGLGAFAYQLVRGEQTQPAAISTPPASETPTRH